jgi:hypothetical protein
LCKPVRREGASGNDESQTTIHHGILLVIFRTFACGPTNPLTVVTKLKHDDDICLFSAAQRFTRCDTVQYRFNN